MTRAVAFWSLLGGIAFAVLPWYAIYDGFWAFDWLLDGYPLDPEFAPGAVLVLSGKTPWLAPTALFLALPLAAIGRRRSDPLVATALLIAGAGGLICGRNASDWQMHR